MDSNNNSLLSADELLGYFNEHNDEGNYVLNMKEAREERASVILSKQQKD